MSISTLDHQRSLTASLPNQPGVNVILTELSGEEGISTPFTFTLSTLIQPELGAILNAAQLMDQPIAFEAHRVLTGHIRNFHGIVTEATLGLPDYRGFVPCTLTVKPWLSLLDQTVDCRIYQNLSIPEIVELICREFGMIDYQLMLTQDYASIPTLTQYNESYSAFIQRILAHVGIYFYFRFEADQHVMVLIDHTASMPYCEKTAVYHHGGNADEPHVSSWQSITGVASQAIAFNHYNPDTPDAKMAVLAQAPKSTHAHSQHHDTLKHHRYHTEYDVPEIGQQLAQQHLIASTNAANYIQGRGGYLDFSAGHRFDVSDLPQTPTSGAFYLTHVRHQAHDYSSVGEAQDHAATSVHHYSNHFTALPMTQRYAPALISAPKAAPQSAIVVGTEAGELNTNTQAAVKVQFPWDRYFADDPNPTRWIRVGQRAAGAAHGQQFLPRVGSEVWVNFMAGNPDRPVIDGMLYNDQNLPPYALPDNKHISGIKTRTVGSESADDANEIRFNDMPGEQGIYMQAQNEFHQIITGDEQTRVHANQTQLVAGEHTITSHASIHYQALEQMNISAGDVNITLSQAGIHIITPLAMMGLPGLAASLPKPVPVFMPGDAIEALKKQQKAKQYPRIAVEFKTKELAIPDYNDGDYNIQTRVTVSGKVEMLSDKKVDPQTANKPQLQAQARASVEQLFSKVVVKSLTGNLTKNVTMTLGLENQDYQVSLVIIGNLPRGIGFILKGKLTQKAQKLRQNNWQISGSLTFDVTIFASKKNNDGDTESNWDELTSYLHANIKQIGEAIGPQLLRLASQLQGVLNDLGTATQETGEAAEGILDNYVAPVVDFLAPLGG